MKVESMIKGLYNKDNNAAFKALLDLEELSTISDELYYHIDEFLNMLDDEKIFIKIRGFRLICSIAKYDVNNIINKNIDKILSVLDTDNGVIVRQCLFKLNLIMLYKIELNNMIEDKLKNIDISRFKESMQSLIIKDINELI